MGVTQKRYNDISNFVEINHSSNVFDKVKFQEIEALGIHLIPRVSEVHAFYDDNSELMSAFKCIFVLYSCVACKSSSQTIDMQKLDNVSV